jgi:hypothetical protein
MRIIIVHSLGHALVALESAQAIGCKVTLQSAPDAIYYAGGLYLFELFAQAKASYPKVEADFILDCSDAGAEAIAAMQTGHRLIRSSAPAPIREKLASIAAQCGAVVVEGEYEALDLHGARDTTSACEKWLKGTI